MSLENKLITINEPSLKETIGFLETEYYKNVDDFIEGFIIKRLPQKEFVKKWHTLLMSYCNDLENLSCAVRYGNSASKEPSKSGETGNLKLRRGWLTQNRMDNFEYFYADNYMASFIYKMVIDGYCPESVEELRRVFREHKFPFGFNFHRNKEFEEIYRTIDTGKEPGFLRNYKISHIFDTGKNYDLNICRSIGIKELSEKYFDIGSRDEWGSEECHIRKKVISNEDKKAIVANFLRFIHPLNMFLTPSTKKHSCEANIKISDIGEYSLVIERLKDYIKKTYPVEYKEFIEQIMWYESSSISNVTEEININIFNKNSVSTKLNQSNESISCIKIGHYAKNIFEYLLKSQSISITALENLMNIEYCKQNLDFNYPIITKNIPLNLKRRYYSKGVEITGSESIAGVYFISNHWYKKHQIKLDTWLSNSIVWTNIPENIISMRKNICK